MSAAAALLDVADGGRAVVEAIERLLVEANRLREARATARMEARLARRLRVTFRAQLRVFLRRWSNEAARPIREAPPEDNLPLPAHWERHWHETEIETSPLFRTAIEQEAGKALANGAQSVLRRLGGSVDVVFDLRNPRAASYLATVGNRVVGINATTREAVQRVLVKAVSEGWSYQQTAARLRETWAGFARPVGQQHLRDRAELIATTEIGEAYEAGTNAAARQLRDFGVPMEKAWQTASDHRVDTSVCRANEEQGWIPFEQAFQSGHDHPLAHPSCRCTAQYRPTGGED